MTDVSTLAQPHAVDLDKVLAFERHSARAWPAPDVTRRDGWELRLTPGSRSRRVNSLNAMAPDAECFPDVLADARARCAARDLPCTIRLTPLTPLDALEALVASGRGTPQGETLVMQAILADIPAPGSTASAVEVAPRVTAPWLEGIAASGADAAERALIDKLVGAVEMPQGFATAYRDGAPVSVGRVAVENGIAGVFHIATAPEARRRGFGRAVMDALLAWARDRGARTAYLQVVAENHPAVALYRGQGFGEAYRYAYLQA